MKGIAVYSAFFGCLNKQACYVKQIDIKYPHFFFSNNSEVLAYASSLGWTSILLDYGVSECSIISSQQAKLVKICPELFEALNGFQYLLYVDDKINLDLKSFDELTEVLDEKGSSMALCPHYFLSGNVLFEFGESMIQSRYKEQWNKPVQYITEEIKNGYNLECFMYQTGIILRNMNHKDTKLINQRWYEHMLRAGINCQISFDIVSQGFGSISCLPSYPTLLKS